MLTTILIIAGIYAVISVVFGIYAYFAQGSGSGGWISIAFPLWMCVALGFMWPVLIFRR